ncbi:MAG: hypothetical protein AB4063_17125 [Crocosphaera sp.]
MAKKKKKKGFGFLNELKKLTPATPPLNNLVSSYENPTFLEKLISQFRGGEKDFSVALDKFRDVYGNCQKDCETLRRSLLREQLHQRQREHYYPLISQFKTHFETFLAHYTPQEQGTLVEAFMLPEMAEVVDLFRESYRSEEAIILTPSQIEHCLVYWVHYQIFKDYMIHPPEFSSFLWDELDSILFKEKDTGNSSLVS